MTGRTITRIRILPPLAFGRLGSASTPQDNYSTTVNPADPFGHRLLKGEETLRVDPQTGAVTESFVPDTLILKEKNPRTGRWQIRPVAPFLEVWAEVGGSLVPLDVALLNENRLTPDAVSWSVSVANLKVYRRTGREDDRVTATVGPFSDHAAHALQGTSPSFEAGSSINFGSVRYIRPTDAFPEIRFRFTPGRGQVYGSSLPTDDDDSVPIPNRIYKTPRGKGWYGWDNVVRDDDGNAPDGPDRRVKQRETLGPTLYAIEGKAPVWMHGDAPVLSRGYLDDACDGTVTVSLKVGATTLTAMARICSAPPNFVLDAGFPRTLGDDLEQALLGPAVGDAEPGFVLESGFYQTGADTPAQHDAMRARAEDVVRRAFDTVRFMNVPVLNNNLVRGRYNLADNMPVNDALDFGRPLQPAMAPENAETQSVTRLHKQALASLKAGIPVWFLRLLRTPEEVGDLSDQGRRKMPALMSGAEGRYMTLTRRQLDIFSKASKPPKGGA